MPPQECHLVIAEGAMVKDRSPSIAGRVTSIAFSPTLQRYIGLAYVLPGMAVIGSNFSIRGSDGSLVTARVSPTPFYDPNNLRQKQGSRSMELS
ncbi:glycine cleavage T C-terminal barrel domain-containing protein [Neosynechococcus sphagnicola]|uniref:glycine cleavage T C-terminal barrel domain-containing protein n=1 Tax=Neosynechococcus sphagnicola TaxID=1501145 RepID=UPI001EF9CE53|nr:glycine cleavage T C-terminal barrel domain-containing protein [Neosynechococcus sphagnicola]